ncbi:endonuclease-reverse transcriptase [Plakobranchus ocellatus]|uniref:Endonuclease-reverse transcriptase n=1 Tax=Plakobranchus ocellatus TaxID=259542 RepID=A0AAV3YCS0_9GAST|nr:endonuclease-reverse transcriptase [Plakobranchus ocellatus]
MEERLKRLNSESKKDGLKIHKGKTKYMTNYITERPIVIDNENIELVPKYTYLGQTTTMKNRTNEEIITRIRKAWYTFGKYRDILQDTTLPITLKIKIYDQCITTTMTYGCQTWTLNKQLCHKLKTAQRSMERKMLHIKLKDRIPTIEIRKKTQGIDVVQYIQRQKWRWTGHIAREKDNIWTTRCSEWQPRSGRRDRGRSEARWIYDIRRAAGPQWQRNAQDRRK